MTNKTCAVIALVLALGLPAGAVMKTQVSVPAAPMSNMGAAAGVVTRIAPTNLSVLPVAGLNAAPGLTLSAPTLSLEPLAVQPDAAVLSLPAAVAAPAAARVAAPLATVLSAPLESSSYKGSDEAARYRASVAASAQAAGLAQAAVAAPETMSAKWDGSRAGVSAAEAVPAGGGSQGASRRSGLSKTLRRIAFTGATALAISIAPPVQAIELGMEITAFSGGSLALALLAGIMAFLSPCVLPLIPGYISFVSGLSRDELTNGADRSKVMMKSALGAGAFILGFTAVFTLLGATATALGGLLAGNLSILTKVAGGFIVLFGLHSMGLLKIPFLYRDVRFHGATGAGYLGALFMGAAFAFGWTPCIGPILAGILGLAASQATVASGMALLAAFSLGLGIPFLITALSVNSFMRFFAKYKRFIGIGEKVSGGFLIALGVLMATGSLTDILQWVPDFFQKFAF